MVGPYLIMKSGIEIKYKKVQTTYKNEQLPDYPSRIKMNLDNELWIQEVMSTGVTDLVQFILIDDNEHQLFIVTWNLVKNREHSMYQGNYTKSQMPINLITRSFCIR